MRPRFHPWVGKIPWRRKWQPFLVFLPRTSRGQRSLVNYSPWVHNELDMTDSLTLSLLQWMEGDFKENGSVLKWVYSVTGVILTSTWDVGGMKLRWVAFGKEAVATQVSWWGGMFGHLCDCTVYWFPCFLIYSGIIFVSFHHDHR